MTKRRRPGSSKKLVEARFWGLPVGDGDGDSPGARKPPGIRPTSDPDSPGLGPGARKPPGIRPTSDPGALVRSLGPPPLAVDPAVAERHLTAVYEEAVRAATALAAVNGLLARDEPQP